MAMLSIALASLDALEKRIVDMELQATLLAAPIDPVLQQPRTGDQEALDVAYMTLASLRNQRSLLLTTIERLRRTGG